MAKDVEHHCHECTKCQQAKIPISVKAPLMSIPVGRPRQMVAVDVLEVPVSYITNRYFLVIQDYFTKWAEAIPMRDQTAMWITVELMKVFSVLEVPDVLHSDQGQNFENTILRRHWRPLELKSLTPQHITHKVTVMVKPLRAVSHTLDAKYFIWFRSNMI